jgi:lipopolysaccharide/colanic/teichoic acid biosynthesis glycosyltransferase
MKSAKSADNVFGSGLPRGFEVVVSLLGLVLLFPLIAVSAALVVLTSRGGVMFRQQRVGRHGKMFVLYKLRTMRFENRGPLVTSRDDARITPVGRILRQTKLDELPSLWNVLKGDMALVGPRPEVSRYVKLEDSMWQAVLRVKPGITDPVTLQLRNEEELLAQVKGDRETYYASELLPLKLKGYVAYLKERNWRTDLEVLIQTVVAVVGMRSVPPRGSGWVVEAGSLKIVSSTRPLPRGGTDLMTPRQE